ncbi:uncharacterized protein CTHT_0015650 [Thermochaetoides thermophila DSM 1495]|uniref:Uncharacterized protein n=1 Tax=Chaetomium thermophilum (strain DSM 1495 / CBS 144.50 / IMI 039719) TaxID=759272 RepID=G0S218_CHATD|nr:hypothetical protein CTHT_0015650 [Thermochaetoides thermophila DSM 1495]EGS23078.1 hypothetical protein CTHT_0015650 [Thermochaetoides thermophila DSM 1495]
MSAKAYSTDSSVEGIRTPSSGIISSSDQDDAFSIEDGSMPVVITMAGSSLGPHSGSDAHNSGATNPGLSATFPMRWALQRYLAESAIIEGPLYGRFLEAQMQTDNSIPSPYERVGFYATLAMRAIDQFEATFPDHVHV